MSRRLFIRRIISKAEYFEAYRTLTGTEPWDFSDEEFADHQRILFEDDWIRPISENEYSERFNRVGGDVVCFICGQIYYDHPYEQRLYPDGYDHQLCNGWIGHT
jgi:hypothetical protein